MQLFPIQRNSLIFSKPKTTNEESNAEINEGGIIINPNNYSIRPRFLKTNENMQMSQDEIIKNKIFKVPTLIEDYSVNFLKELFKITIGEFLFAISIRKTKQ